jgi:hypothetical protein
MTWLKLSAGVLGGVLGAFGEELGFAAGFCDITTVGEGYTKVRCGCGGVDSIWACRVWILWCQYQRFSTMRQ